MEGSDGTADTTTLVQIEEAKCAIRKLPFVTVLAPVRAVADKGRGWQVSLSCSRCQEYGSCHKKQEPAVRLSSTHPTELACLQELLKRLQDRHVECAEALTTKAAADAQAAAAVSPDRSALTRTVLQQTVEERAHEHENQSSCGHVPRHRPNSPSCCVS